MESISPIPKPERKKRRSRGKFQDKKRGSWWAFRKGFLKGKSDYRGYYQCALCSNWFAQIDVDHIIKRSVAPHRVFDITNLQLSCRSCHVAKDGGMKIIRGEK